MSDALDEETRQRCEAALERLADVIEELDQCIRLIRQKLLGGEADKSS
jgi:hypothetical protein